jgi:hypothetical protein
LGYGWLTPLCKYYKITIILVAHSEDCAPKSDEGGRNYKTNRPKGRAKKIDKKSKA